MITCIATGVNWCSTLQVSLEVLWLLPCINVTSSLIQSKMSPRQDIVNSKMLLTSTLLSFSTCYQNHCNLRAIQTCLISTNLKVVGTIMLKLWLRSLKQSSISNHLNLQEISKHRCQQSELQESLNNMPQRSIIRMAFSVRWYRK